ncbi:hypothetical protein [Reyranella sp.]|uniref:hypothetical protein n=1 Tax=Reyranella sp. TaxID=1929291 RepID=UPI0025EC6741|nr:hypothetical protein [Reyranella sp.]
MAADIMRRLSSSQLMAILIRTLIRVLIPLARSARREDDNLVVLAFGIAAYAYGAGFEGRFSDTEIRRFRALVQATLRQEHKSQIASRVAFALDYFLEAANSRFSDTGAVRRAFDAFLNLDPRLNEGVHSDSVASQSMTEASTVDMLTMPLQSRGGAMTQNQVVATALARGESWRPWASWLRDRFVGGKFYKLNSRYYSTIPAVLWPDAAKVNGWLVGATPSIEDQPLYEPVNPDAFEPNPDDIDAQETTSVSFTITDANQVHLDSEAGQSSLLDDQLSHDLHQELIERITELESACASSNSLAELAVAILKFRSSLGRSPLTLSPGPAVLRGNALRNDLEVDQRRRGKEDPDHPPLPEGIAGSLKELVEAWNIYVGCDPYLDEMDRRRLGPDERNRAQFVPGEFTGAIDSAEREKLATEDAISILRDAEAVAQNTTIASDRALAFLLGTMRNFTRSAFRLALRNKAKIGGGFFVVVQWAHAHEALLRKLLVEYPNLIAILDWLLEATKLLLL